MQLEPFDPPVVTLPPCGRRECPRKGVVEHGQYYCNVCNCSAPIPQTIFDGYIQSQLKFLQSRSRRRGA